MSGHNKWSTIKHKKGALDAKRGKLWTKILKPVVDKLLEPPPPPPEPEETEGIEIGPDGMPHFAHQHGHQAYEEKLAAARELARKDPKAVANMIKEWMDGGEGK